MIFEVGIEFSQSSLNLQQTTVECYKEESRCAAVHPFGSSFHPCVWFVWSHARSRRSPTSIFFRVCMPPCHPPHPIVKFFFECLNVDFTCIHLIRCEMVLSSGARGKLPPLSLDLAFLPFPPTSDFRSMKTNLRWEE